MCVFRRVRLHNYVLLISPCGEIFETTFHLSTDLLYCKVYQPNNMGMHCFERFFKFVIKNLFDFRHLIMNNELMNKFSNIYNLINRSAML